MRRATLAVLAVIALLAACSEDPADPGYSGDRLPEPEALGVINAMILAADETRNGMLQEQQRPAPAPAPGEMPRSFSVAPSSFSFTHASTHPCPASGRIAIELSVDVVYDEEARNFDYDAQGALTHEQCGFTHDDATFTVTGDPNLSLATQVKINAGVFEPVTESLKGAFEWSADDGRSGRCVVDLSRVVDLVNKNYHLQGEVCGHTIEQTITWS